jgi:hypothetical protein
MRFFLHGDKLLSGDNQVHRIGDYNGINRYQWIFSSSCLFRKKRQEKAYHLSLYFRSIFEKKILPQEAAKEFWVWYTRVDAEWIIELISAASTIRLNEGKILVYFKNRETNVWAKSFNAKIKWFRALVRWMRDTTFFLYRVEQLYA